MTAPTFTNVWDETAPANTGIDAGDGDDYIRNTKLDWRERIAAFAPIGFVIKWPYDINPTGWLTCDGSAVSKATYPALYTFLCDGGASCIYGETVTTFNLPDKRGRFLRGWSHGKTGNMADPDAATRTNRGDGTGGDYPGTLQDDAMQTHTHYIDVCNTTTPRTDDFVVGEYLTATTDEETGSAGGAEFRPLNRAVKYLIRALDFLDNDGVFNFVRAWNELTPLYNDYSGFAAREIRDAKIAFRERMNALFPAGMLAWWPSDTAPEGWMLATGATLNVADYPYLFDVFEYAFGGNDDDEFCLPDFRGCYIRAVDGVAGRDPDVLTRAREDGVTGDYAGTVQAAEIIEHTHNIPLTLTWGVTATFAYPSHTIDTAPVIGPLGLALPFIATPDGVASAKSFLLYAMYAAIIKGNFPAAAQYLYVYNYIVAHYGSQGAGGSGSTDPSAFNITNNAGTGSETRPKTILLNLIIKVENVGEYQI